MIDFQGDLTNASAVKKPLPGTVQMHRKICQDQIVETPSTQYIRHELDVCPELCKSLGRVV